MALTIAQLIADAEQLPDAEFPEASQLPGIVAALVNRLSGTEADVAAALEPDAPAPAAPPADGAPSPIESTPAPAGEGEPATPAAPEATVAPEPPVVPAETDAQKIERLEGELGRVQALLAPPAGSPPEVASA